MAQAHPDDLKIALELERQILEGPIRAKTRIEITGRDAFGRTITEVVVDDASAVPATAVTAFREIQCLTILH